MAYSWQSDIIRPDGENGTEVLDGQGVYQPQLEGGDNITIEDGKISASGTLETVQADYTETDSSAPSYIKHKPDLSIYATTSGMETALDGKQDVIDDLSTIRSGAEAGSTAVQPGDLAAVATTGSYTSLTNTPQNIVQDASYVHTDNNFTNADKGKLDGIAAGAEVNVQSNWNETDPSSDAYIANKPTIPAAQQNADWNASSGVTAILNKPDLSAYATDSELADGLATKQNVISDLDTIRSGAALGATAVQPSQLPSSDELVPSASSGDAGKILTVDAQGEPQWVTPSGGTTYSAGDGVDIDSNNVISADVDGVTIGIDSTTKKIKSLQTIPTVDQTYNAASTNAQSGVAVAQAIATASSKGSLMVKSGTTQKELYDAWVAGWTIQSNHGNDINVYELSNFDYDFGEYTATFKRVYFGETLVYETTFTINGLASSTSAVSFGTETTKTSNQVPAAYSQTVGKVLTIKSVPYEDPIASWESPATVTVDQTYNAASTNAQSGTAVAGAIAGVNQVPASTSSDENKVLTVNASGTPVWATAQGGNSSIYEASGTDTYADIYAANQAGKLVIYYYSDVVYTLDKLRSNDSTHTTGFIHFINLSDNAGGLNAQSISGWTYAASDTLAQRLSSQSKAMIPASPSSNAGKYLAANEYGNIVFATPSEVPASTSADENKVLTVNSSGTPVWAASSAPSSKPLVAGANITITDGASDVTIAATVPTVDQTYDASSTNAQSGVAVASAISGINAVPASTSADQDKVLTVNSSGTPVWATAQGGGGGSGGDSEFPYDPGYMHTGWGKMVVRFGDTSYDPTTKSSASSFTSIVALNEPGVYEYTFNTSDNHDQYLFRNEWNDITNNPVDILQLTSNSSNIGGYYGNLFYGCTGLRSVWNMRGEFGYIGYWFYGCENLEIVSGKIPERYASNEVYYGSGIFVIVGELSSTFDSCSSLKRIELIIDAKRANLTRACGRCTSLEVGPGIFGLVTSLDYAFSGCGKMLRLYGFSDFPKLMSFAPDLIDSPAQFGYTLSAEEAFSYCTALRDFNGTTLDLLGPISNLHKMFSECSSLTKVPPIVVASSNVDISNMFNYAINLTEIPDIDYTKVTNAAYAFSDCKHLVDVNGLIGLATACTNVDGLLMSCWSVRRGCTELYNALSASGSAVTNHDMTFDQTGSASGNDVRSQIPSSWGGTGA